MVVKGKRTVGYQWVYTVKIGLDGSINSLKPCLVAKYTRIFLA